MNEKTGITISKETYWKLVEAKVKLKCKNWDEFADKITELIKRCVGEVDGGELSQ